MKKKALAAIVVAMSIGVLAGCGDQKSPIIPESQPVSTEAASTGETTPTSAEPVEPVNDGPEVDVITERTVVDGKMQSYLTGEWKDAEVVTRRNFAVMIPNNKPALPQYGISLASIIYEAPVEGRITRLMGFFEDYDDLDRVGPVRSSRDYFLYESMAYDSIYCNWGLAVPFVGPVINTDRVDNISQAVAGIDSPSSEAFDRVSRAGSYATEFTGYMFISGYKSAVNRHGYATEYTDRFEQAFTFANDTIMEYADYPDATKIYPGGNVSNKGGYADAQPCFTYNADDHLYYRTQFGGPQIDEYNGEQLAVTNVIYKICHGEVREPSDKDYLAFGVHGSGNAVIFTNGKVIEGTWQRNSDYEPNLFFDENGEEIVFNQGKTWICCIWEEYQEYSIWE